jgi:proteasome lid subunit RPN8/RPN11
MVFDRQAYDTIVEHAVRTYPEECCGAIVGVVEGGERLVRDAWPLENVADTRRNRYTISPRDYLQTERRARGLGVSVLGFYHSHPDAPSKPSAHDLEHAWPDLSYVIVSVRGDRAQPSNGDDGARPSSGAVVTSWRLHEDRSGFENEEMTWPSAS